MVAGGKENVNCGVCVNKVTKRTGKMKCERMCNKWYHLKCINITKEECEEFGNLAEKSIWYFWQD